MRLQQMITQIMGCLILVTHSDLLLIRERCNPSLFCTWIRIFIFINELHLSEEISDTANAVYEVFGSSSGNITVMNQEDSTWSGLLVLNSMIFVRGSLSVKICSLWQIRLLWWKTKNFKESVPANCYFNLPMTLSPFTVVLMKQLILNSNFWPCRDGRLR